MVETPAKRLSQTLPLLESQCREALVLALETLRGWLWTAEWLVLPVSERVVGLEDGVDLPRPS